MNSYSKRNPCHAGDVAGIKAEKIQTNYGKNNIVSADEQIILKNQNIPLPTFDELPTAFKELASLPIWVSWKNEHKSSIDGKPHYTKIPKNPKNGLNAKTNDPSTWTSFAEAYKYAASRSHGVGIVFCGIGEGNYLAGLDIDSCRNPSTGEIAQWAIKVVERFETYAEISPSRTGLKLFFKIAPALSAELIKRTESGCKYINRAVFKKQNTLITQHPEAFELYLRERYFTVTGEMFGKTAEIAALSYETW